MNKKKEKLREVLEQRNGADWLENLSSENLSSSEKKSEDSFDGKSKKRIDKKRVDSIKRFQDFSGLQPTGRINKLTQQQSEKPYCSFPNITTNELIAASSSLPRWNTTNITFSFRNFTSQLTSPQIRNAVRQGFDLWKSAFPPFQFREVSLDDAPMIIISFVTGSHADGFPFSGGDGDLAHAFPPNFPSGGLAGQIHFDDAESWSVTLPTTRKDLVTVAAHEIGHALGLGHSTLKQALMFAIYEKPNRNLHQEDKDNIRNLYS